jgi:hypothetical protein
MIRAKTQTAEDVIRWMESEAAVLWPVRRCHSLDRERGGRPVAGDARFAELSPQSVWTRELPGLSVRRAASEPCSLRPAQRTPVRGVCSRRPCRRGALGCRQRACLAGPAGASWATLCQGVAAMSVACSFARRAHAASVSPWKEPDPAGRSGRPYGPEAGQLRSNASLDTFCYC